MVNNMRKTNLVNEPRFNPEDLTIGLKIITVEDQKTGMQIYHNYHTLDTDAKRAKKFAIKLLREKLGE